MQKEFKPTQNKNTLAWSLILLSLIDVPLLLFLFFGLQAPTFVLVLLVFIIVLIDGVVLSLTFLGKTMRYKLTDDELKVNFGFSKRTISYSTIQRVQIFHTTLLLRLFGGSWPGFHWGYYKAKDLGNLWVYSTKMRGDFVLIELVDGKKILLSPQNTQEFLDELNSQKNLFATIKPEQIQTLAPSNKAIYLQILCVTGAFLVFLGYLLWIYPTLPEIIPVHFDFNMNPNRWSHKSELFILAGVAAIFPALNAILAMKFGKYGKGLMIFLGIVFIVTIVLFLGILYFTQSII